MKNLDTSFESVDGRVNNKDRTNRNQWWPTVGLYVMYKDSKEGKQTVLGELASYDMDVVGFLMVLSYHLAPLVVAGYYLFK